MIAASLPHRREVRDSKPSPFAAAPVPTPVPTSCGQRVGWCVQQDGWRTGPRNRWWRDVVRQDDPAPGARVRVERFGPRTHHNQQVAQLTSFSPEEGDKRGFDRISLAPNAFGGQQWHDAANAAHHCWSHVLGGGNIRCRLPRVVARSVTAHGRCGHHNGDVEKRCATVSSRYHSTPDFESDSAAGGGSVRRSWQPRCRGAASDHGSPGQVAGRIANHENRARVASR